METDSRPRAGHPQATLSPSESEGWRTGWTGFDALGLVRAGRLLLVDSAGEAASDLLFRLLAGAVKEGHEAVVMDGGCWLDPYRLGDAARALGLRRDDALASVRLARGFTAYQLDTLIHDTLPDATRDPRVGLALVSCLPAMYEDDDMKPSEARVLLARALATLREVARSRRIPVVASNTTLAPRARSLLRRALDEGVDEAVALYPASHGGLRVHPRGWADAVLVPKPGARQRVLGEFGTDPSAPWWAFARGHYDPRIRYAPKHAGELKFKQREQAKTNLHGVHALAGGS